MTVRFVVIAEDELGYRLTRDLTDRVVVERGEPWLQELWRDESIRASQRAWTGIRGNERWSSRGDVKRLAEEHSIRAHGHGMKATRAMAHKATQIVAKLVSDGAIDRADAVFLVHDTDGDEGVGDLLRAGARGKGEPQGYQVVIATPHPESEAWVIAGLALISGQQRERHREERERLGFDPVTRPERLSSNRATDKRDAKRVCEALAGACGGAYEHWESAWLETPLERLELNADRARLRDYTRQVERIILPLLGDDHLR